MFERPARPADRFVNPYLNDNEARANNNGAYPPDLSVITKARRYGEDYIYNLLMGYEEPPEGLEVGDGMYYNKWMDGNQIAMPAPILDGSVDYDDGTDTTAQQLSEDPERQQELIQGKAHRLEEAQAQEGLLLIRPASVVDLLTTHLQVCPVYL